ncbi:MULTISPECIES: CDP-alcohol phosphatidyltransferase family protein [unclassified Leifsonia]|uniref:CDP-alcohol phosphatidyltransferase family protein n=1 Tax=unclassified Leifsonia TaxID=2663824 RepID=UPI000B3349D8|nr:MULTISPECIES: CDP-alcohol phosphatidyltransferase family protein [unclassified Leifsonia]
MAEPSEPTNRIWTVPNVLSMLRLVLVPFFLGYLIVGDYITALVILVISSFTDFLDGFVARRFNQISRLGQLLDPAADRLYLFASILGLAAGGLVPWWLVAVIVGRDVFLALLGILLANHGFGPLPVHQLGKVATFALFLGLPVLMLGAAFPVTAAVALPIGWAITLWGVFLYWWAGIIYAIETGRVIRLPLVQSPRRSDTLEE